MFQQTFVHFNAYSDIYSAPRLVDSLENVVSSGGNGGDGSLGVLGSSSISFSSGLSATNTSIVNGNNLTQRNRIASLTTTPSLLAQPLDSGSSGGAGGEGGSGSNSSNISLNALDSKNRQGKKISYLSHYILSFTIFCVHMLSSQQHVNRILNNTS